MKILSNKAYSELIAEKELTELSLKSLKSKYEFIQDENKKLHFKNDLLHIEIKSLREKAEKYDIYLQKSRARKAKARAKEKGLQKKETIDQVAVSEPVEQVTGMSEVEKFAMENLGRKVISKYGGVSGYICGYNVEMAYLIISVEIGKGWELVNSSDVILADHPKSMLYRDIENIYLTNKR